MLCMPHVTDLADWFEVSLYIMPPRPSMSHPTSGTGPSKQASIAAHMLFMPHVTDLADWKLSAALQVGGEHAVHA